MNTLCIIPARGGSKRIPRKNIRNFLGKPIIAYSIEAAVKSGIFSEVMISTDDAEIAGIAKEYGAQVPFFRSPKNSSDMAFTVPVLLEVLDEYQKLGKNFAAVACVYPCAPFVSLDLLKQASEVLQSGADSVAPLIRYSAPPQRRLVVRDGIATMLHPENYNRRSQDFEAEYQDAGQFYFLRTEALRKDPMLYCGVCKPVIISESDAQDIDNEEDWRMAEFKYQALHTKHLTKR
jgi:N-acylneuraminate cytidylyltransferase